MGFTRLKIQKSKYACLFAYLIFLRERNNHEFSWLLFFKSGIRRIFEQQKKLWKFWILFLELNEKKKIKVQIQEWKKLN